MIYAFFLFVFVQKSFLTKNFFLSVEINLTTRSPLYTCLVLIASINMTSRGILVLISLVSRSNYFLTLIGHPTRMFINYRSCNNSLFRISLTLKDFNFYIELRCNIQRASEDASIGATFDCLWHFFQFYPDELENFFGNFGDFVQTFELTRGKEDDEEDDNVVGEFKVNVGFERKLNACIILYMKLVGCTYILGGFLGLKAYSEKF